MKCRNVGPVNFKDNIRLEIRLKTRKEAWISWKRAELELTRSHHISSKAFHWTCCPLLKREGTTEGTFCRGTFLNSPFHPEWLHAEGGGKTIPLYRCLYWSANALKQEIYLKTACGHKISATLTAGPDECTFNDINNNIIIQGRKQRTNGMYPGIILYANRFIRKNLTCGNQKTLPLALTLWFGLVILFSGLLSFGYLVLPSPQRSEATSESDMWDTEKVHRHQSLATEPLPAAVHKVAKPSGHLHSLHGL